MLTLDKNSSRSLAVSVAVTAAGAAIGVWHSGSKPIALLLIPLLFLSALSNNLHFAHGILMFYRYPVVSEVHSKGSFRLRFILVPAAYGAIFIAFSFYLETMARGLLPVLFVVAAAGPLAALHISAQDKGMLTIIGMGAGPRLPPTMIRSFIFPALFAGLTLLLSRHFLFVPDIMVQIERRFGVGAPAVREAALVFGSSLAVALAALAAWFWLARRHGQAALYSLAIGAGTLAEVFSSRPGLFKLCSLAFVFRHHLVYVNLVRSYFGVADLGRPANYGVIRDRLIVFLGIAFAGCELLVLLTVPGLFDFLVPELTSHPWIGTMRPLSMGLFLSITLHHYYIDAHMWRFSDPRIRGHFTSTMGRAGKLASVAAIGALILPGIAAADVKPALRPEDTLAKCVRFDSKTFHRFLPDCSEKAIHAGQTNEMRYNRQGLRDKNYPPKPAPGWTRILFMGPSCLAGPGMPEALTAPRRLEAMLKKSIKNIEIVNAGVQGYASLHTAAAANEWLDAYSPTHAVLFVHFPTAANNDMLSNAYATWSADEVPTLSPRLYPVLQFLIRMMGVKPDSPEFPPLYKKLFTAQSMINRSIRSQWCSLRYGAGDQRNICHLTPTLRAILSIKRSVEKRGIKFLLVFPASYLTNSMFLSPAYDVEIAQRLDRITPRIQMTTDSFRRYFDSLGTIRYFVYDPSPLREHYLPGDYHFNAEGAQDAANRLLPGIRAFLDTK